MCHSANDRNLDHKRPPTVRRAAAARLVTVVNGVREPGRIASKAQKHRDSCLYGDVTWTGLQYRGTESRLVQMTTRLSCKVDNHCHRVHEGVGTKMPANDYWRASATEKDIITDSRITDNAEASEAVT